ncbi:MAG: hypothetical protein LPK47_07785, partial [Bacteroidota bacterium]|nr:hypothetical protein [Bacteroidota bacterium]
RDANNVMSEHKLPVEMPGLLGAGAEFIPFKGNPSFSNEVIKLDSLTDDTVLVGYIFGGIQSSSPNIFWVNTGTESSASSTIYKVHLISGRLVNIDEVNPQSIDGLKMQVYTGIPGILYVDYWLGRRTPVTITVHDLMGKQLTRKEIPAREWIKGNNHVEVPVGEVARGSTLLITLETRDQKVTQKMISF